MFVSGALSYNSSLGGNMNLDRVNQHVDDLRLSAIGPLELLKEFLIEQKDMLTHANWNTDEMIKNLDNVLEILNKKI